ncbi:MAG TPA: hypothetical protein VGI35_03435 [Steroidobacteraceae bacterium]
MKRITAALLLGAAVFAPAARVHADPGQTTSTNQGKGAQSTNDDAALMEFLGGIGSEDDAWIDYLARTDPTKIAAQAKRARSDGNKPSDPPHAQADSSNGSQKQ